MWKTAQILARENSGRANPVKFDRSFLPGGQFLPGENAHVLGTRP